MEPLVPELDMSVKRCRNWYFTHDNYYPHQLPTLSDKGPKMIWLKYGQEVDDEGTPNLTGIIRFQHGVYSHQVRRVMAFWGMYYASFSPVTNEIEDFIDYKGGASKEEGTLHEYGTAPMTERERIMKGGAATKARYNRIRRLAKLGHMDTIKFRYPGDFGRMARSLKKIVDESEDAINEMNHEELEEWTLQEDQVLRAKLEQNEKYRAIHKTAAAMIKEEIPEVEGVTLIEWD